MKEQTEVKLTKAQMIRNVKRLRKKDRNFLYFKFHPEINMIEMIWEFVQFSVFQGIFKKAKFDVKLFKELIFLASEKGKVIIRIFLL